MLSAGLPSVFEAGNIGIPFSEVVAENDSGTAVLEVSSFQGRSLKSFKPSIGAFLNFSEDHLDWHPDLRDYLESKYRVFSRQSDRDLLFIDGSYRELEETPTQARKVDIRKEVRI